FGAQLRRVRSLRREQLRRARRKEAGVLVEVGKTKALAVLRVGRPAGAESLAHGGLVRLQARGAAPLVEREHFLRQALVDTLGARAAHAPRALRSPAGGRREAP